jgi:hypothetical protein
MIRQSRTFKLRLSPAGMDLLIDSHCHLIRSTRALLAWGTTLHVAVTCLDKVPAEMMFEQLARLRDAGFGGTEEHHLGAPKALNDIAIRIAERMSRSVPDLEPPTLAHIYILALYHLSRTDADTLKKAYESVKVAPTSDGPGALLS